MIFARMPLTKSIPARNLPKKTGFFHILAGGPDIFSYSGQI
jgi:hypothetical protein